MTHITKFSCAMALVAAGLVPAAASADSVLSTGTPSGTTLPLVLDGTDFYAAEFSLATTSSLNSLAVNLLSGGNSAGATFTVNIYADSNGSISRNASPDYSFQGSYLADGLNSVSFAPGTVEGPGNYWAAIEITPASTGLGVIGGTPQGATIAGDTGSGLLLPKLSATDVAAGVVPALAYAFNAGAGYVSSGAQAFGIQIDATAVPLPASAWLLAGGILGFGALARRRRD